MMPPMILSSWNHMWSVCLHIVHVVFSRHWCFVYIVFLHGRTSETSTVSGRSFMTSKPAMQRRQLRLIALDIWRLPLLVPYQNGCFVSPNLWFLTPNWLLTLHGFITAKSGNTPNLDCGSWMCSLSKTCWVLFRGRALRTLRRWTFRWLLNQSISACNIKFTSDFDAPHQREISST